MTTPLPTVLLRDRELRSTLQSMNGDIASIASQIAGLSGDAWRQSLVSAANVSTSGVLTGIGIVSPLVSASVAPSAAGTVLASLGYGRRDTAAAAGSTAPMALGTSATVWMGNAAGCGGFTFTLYVANVTAGATNRLLWGLQSSASSPNLNVVNPSTFTNCVFLGADDSDANMQMMSNDAAGTCTKVDLGASFPARTSGAFYKLVMTAAANATSIAYTVTRIDSFATTSGTLATDLPASTAFMFCGAHSGNGATAAVQSTGVSKFLLYQPIPY